MHNISGRLREDSFTQRQAITIYGGFLCKIRATRNQSGVYVARCAGTATKPTASPSVGTE